MARPVSLLLLSLAAITLGSSAILVLLDFRPQVFPPREHGYLASFPLGAIAIAWVLWQVARKATASELLRAVLLAAAFLFWAANQLWSDTPRATLYNDLAAGLFVPRRPSFDDESCR